MQSFYADQVLNDIRKCSRKETLVRLEQEYTALGNLYAEQFNIKIGTLVEYNMLDWKDWTEDEADFCIVEKFMYDSFSDESNQPFLNVLTNLDDSAVPITSYRPVTFERFQWMVNNYPEKMIMIWNKSELKLKSNPLYKNIKWPKKLKEEKELVDSLHSVGL